MRVFAFNLSDSIGGAAKAAFRIHQAVSSAGVDSTLVVNRKALQDDSIIGPKKYHQKLFDKFRSGMGVLFGRLIWTKNVEYHSPAIFPTNWHKELNKANIDIVHLHWVHGEMMSIKDIGSIKKPLVWTLHDMWAFSGAEHYSMTARWKDGYNKLNRPSEEFGFDLNRWTWLRKRKFWQLPFQIVTPSNWLADCVRKSALMHGWPVEVIPNPINTDWWQPIDKVEARNYLNLPLDVPLLLFGAIGGSIDPRKGFELLRTALFKLSGSIDQLELVVFGQSAPEEPIDLGYPVHYLGHISDELVMRKVYSAADLLVAPSLQEVFGQTASEAHACACPVVAFEGTGLADVIGHRQTGYLAKLGDIEDLAKGIAWVLQSVKESTTLNKAARLRAVEKFSYPVVAEKYKNIYTKVANHR